MSTTVPIEDVPPYVQITATSLQTVFDTAFTADDDADVVVYARASGVAPNDVTQLIASSNYTVSYVGVDEIVRVTFSVGRTLNDVVTIIRMTPVERLNLYTNTNFTTSMLNGDFGKQTMMIQEREYCDEKLTPKYNNSATVVAPKDIILPVLGAGQAWRKNDGNTAIEVVDVPDGGIAPDDAKYLLQTADGSLPNAQAMGALASGIVVNTTTTGVQLTRTLTGTANQLDVANGTGISGNPTVSITNNPVIPGTAGMGIPQGTTAQRVTPSSGIGLRYNTDLAALEYYNGAWVQLDDADLSLYLLLAGGTMSGVINMGNNKITNLATPTVGTDAVTKTYADLMLPLLGGTMGGNINFGGFKGTNAADPTVSTDYATKGYVDSVAAGLNVLPAVYAASTAALTATYSNGASGVGATLTNAAAMAAFSLDSVSPPLNSTVLIKNQAAPAQNGIYSVTTVGSGAVNWVLTRPTYYDSAAEINAGDFVLVNLGTVNTGTGWIETATVVTVGTDAISFSLFGSGAYALKGANADITSMAGLTGALRAPTMILDTNGNEVLIFSSVGSAINEVTLFNAASGNNPYFQATGGGTNISIGFLPKGDAAVQIFGNSTRAGTFNFYENTANGTDYIQLKAPESVALTYTLTLPSAVGAASGSSMWDNGSGILSLATYANSNITSMTGLTGTLRAPTGIASSAGLGLLGFTYVASAVNSWTIQNAATGSAPVLIATGSDGTVPMQFQSKGGLFNLLDNNSTVGASIRLFNAAASQYTGFKAANAQATTVTFQVPATDVAGVMVSDGSANLSLTATPSVTSVRLSGGTALANYVEGTWTPTDASGAGLTFTTATGKYTRIGNTVFGNCLVGYPATVNASPAVIGGLPIACVNDNPSRGAIVTYSSLSTLTYALPAAGDTTIALYNNVGVGVLNSALTSATVFLSLCYTVS